LKKRFVISIAALFAAMTLMAAEDWRGQNRLAGSVVDSKSGAPVKGAKLELRYGRGGHGGPDITSDNNGKWAILGLAAGPWDVDVSAPGYDTRKVAVQMTEGQRIPPMKIELDPAAPAVAAPADTPLAQEELKIGGVAVSKEIAGAVEAGNAALTAKNYADAVTNFEKASAALPTVAPIKFALARAYDGAGNVEKAIATLAELHQADPANTQYASIYTEMLLNAGIAQMNKKAPAAALPYFTKAIAADEKSHLGYYYRGLAYIQAGKAKDAKADLDKVVELAPNSDEAKEAREYLKSIK
jgi:Tfp pilus assembly protein PilF